MSGAGDDESERYRRRLRAKRQGLRRLGVRNIRCFCGEDDPACFEAEHVDRRANSDVVFGVCKNCHAKITARQMSEHPGVGLYPGDPFERFGHMFLGMCEYLSFITDRLRDAAAVMFKLAGKDIDLEE